MLLKAEFKHINEFQLIGVIFSSRGLDNVLQTHFSDHQIKQKDRNQKPHMNVFVIFILWFASNKSSNELP